MTIFIDNDYRCHTQNDGTMRPFDVSFFDGKTTYFIESYRYVPAGEKWINPKGIIFRGEMVSPWRDYSKAAIAQDGYDEGVGESAEIIGIIDGSVVT